MHEALGGEIVDLVRRHAVEHALDLAGIGQLELDNGEIVGDTQPIEAARARSAAGRARCRTTW